MNQLSCPQVSGWGKASCWSIQAEICVSTRPCQLSQNPGAHAGNFSCASLLHTQQKNIYILRPMPSNSTNKSFRMLIKDSWLLVHFNWGLLEKGFKSNQAHSLLRLSESFVSTSPFNSKAPHKVRITISSSVEEARVLNVKWFAQRASQPSPGLSSHYAVWR